MISPWVIYKGQKRQAGFTLVELLIAMLLAGVITGALYSVYVATLDSHGRQDAIVRTEMNVRAALDFMSRELRMAGYDPEGSGDFGFEEAQQTQVTFRYDADQDGWLSDNEVIAFVFSNGEVQRGFRGGSLQAVATDIETLEFMYLDASGDPLPFLVRVDETHPDYDDYLELRDTFNAQVRAVEITIRGGSEHRGRALPFREMTMLVRCRNMGI